MSEWRLTRSFDFQGRTVRYDVRGAGPPVVLIHGTPWSSFNLRHLIATLSRPTTPFTSTTCSATASPTRRPGDVSLGVQNRCSSPCSTIGGSRRPAAIGHDFGGATLLRTICSTAAILRRIVLIDPVAVSPWGSPFFRHVRATRRPSPVSPTTSTRPWFAPMCRRRPFRPRRGDAGGDRRPLDG